MSADQNTLKQMKSAPLLCFTILAVGCSSGEQKTKFSGIHKIVVSAEHTFVFIGTQMAHVIPKSRVISGNYDTFIARLTEEWESQQGRGEERR